MKNNDKIISEGVSYDKDNDAFIFDFEHDNDHDMIKLISDGPYAIEDYDPCIY